MYFNFYNIYDDPSYGDGGNLIFAAEHRPFARIALYLAQKESKKEICFDGDTCYGTGAPLCLIFSEVPPLEGFYTSPKNFFFSEETESATE